MSPILVLALVLAGIAVMGACAAATSEAVRAHRARRGRTWQAGTFADLRPGQFVRLTWEAVDPIPGQLTITGMVLTRTLAGVSLTEGFVYADDLNTDPLPRIEVYR